MRALLILAALSAGLGGGQHFADDPAFVPDKYPEPISRAKRRNKFLLSDDEIEMLSTMTPKEKKKFLKDRR